MHTSLYLEAMTQLGCRFARPTGTVFGGGAWYLLLESPVPLTRPSGQFFVPYPTQWLNLYEMLQLSLSMTVTECITGIPRLGVRSQLLEKNLQVQPSPKQRIRYSTIVIITHWPRPLSTCLALADRNTSIWQTQSVTVVSHWLSPSSSQSGSLTLSELVWQHKGAWLEAKH